MQNHEKISEDIKLLIIDFLNEKIDNQELRVLTQWIQHSEEHGKLFNAYKTTWLLSKNSVRFNHKSERALASIKQSIEKRKSISAPAFWNVYRIAASWFIVFILGSGITVYFTQRNFTKKSAEVYTSVIAPLGSTTLLDLPDGSKIWLNAGSKITYGSNFGKTYRELHLSGEAFFSVKTNKNKPFLVFTSDVVVKALGTRFNVKAYPEEKTITTTLEEGRVVITSLHQSTNSNAIELKPKEVATFYRYKLKEETVPQKKSTHKDSVVQTAHPNASFQIDKKAPIEIVTSWKEETWVIEAEPLGKFAILLERRYNVKIEFESEDVKSYKFTGKIQNENIEQIMKAIELSAPITYSIHKNVISILMENQRKTKFNQYTKNSTLTF